MKSKKIIIDSIVIGAALFAMFFGAGNMIFPPFLGLECGVEWMGGFWGYYVADIGLAIFAVIAQVNRGSFEEVLSPLGNIPSKLLMLAIVMCLGPLISIPRTCATTFELSISPLMPDFSIFLFSAIFFALTLVLSLNESKVVDVVGKVLTPLLIAGLLFLIIKGIVSPVADTVDAVKTASPVGAGIQAGYQSMDVLGAAVFGVLVITGAKDRGHTDLASKRRVTIGASLVAGIGLFVIYLGLTYLGATASTLFDMHTSRSDLLISIVSMLLPGKVGLIFFGVIAGLACLTTSIALTSSAAKYLRTLTKERLGYKTLVIAICIFSAAVSSLGVEGLVTLASPVLTIVYPPVLAVVLLSFFHKYVPTLAYRLSVLSALLYGIAETFASYGIRSVFLDILPFSKMGLGWVIPWLVIAVAVTVIIRIKKLIGNNCK